MKTSKALLIMAVTIFGFWLPGIAIADLVTVGDTIRLYDGPGSTNGGEFKADVVGKGTSIDFLTFCVERNEYFTFGESLRVAGISSGSVNGGVGGGNPDPLDPRTAYLFYLFSTNALPDYDYTPENGSARVADANALQNLIWYLEDEGVSAPATGSQGANWLALASANAGTSLWGVKVLNLVHANGSPAQDQLYYPVPAPATLLLLGSGLLGFALFARKRA